MSINKVLNRPMFRQRALRKGHLKPIQARVGQSIGGPGVMVGNASPGITGVYNPNRVPMVVNQPTKMDVFKQGAKRFGKGALRTVFGAPGYLFYETNEALKNVEGITPTQRYLASIGAGAFGFTPPGRVVAGGVLGLRGLQLAGMGAEVAKEDIKKFRETPVSKRKVLPDISAEASMDNFPEPATNEEIKEEVKISSKAKPGSGRVGVSRDRLTEQDNESEVVKGSVDINKLVKNNDPNTIPPKPIGAPDTVEEKRGPKKPITNVASQEEDKITDEKANVNTIKAESNNLDKPGRLKAADGTEVNNEVITLARQYRKELMAGQKSQAKLVFLANLASGLLSGTTSKGGLGGALEVFGKALGPAVNNYATIKLKENELENEFMSDALELASDEITARNSLLESPSLDFEKYGVIQFTDSNGRLRNVTGGMLKNGTYVIARPGEVDGNGMQVFSPMPAGTFDRFLPADYATKEQGETLRNLSGKYKALNLGQSTINILADAEASDKKFAGPVGRFNLFTTRLGDAMNDLGLSMFESKEDGERYLEGLKQDFRRDLIADGMTEKEANKFLKDNFGSTDSLLANKLKQLGVFKDQTDAANLERLAINETVLTYALANSLKDKDRLTQKDIQMAKDLVNVFPLLRGQKQVIKSLEAVNETILADIKRLENDYQFAFGGDTSTIDKYRQQYGVATPDTQNFELQNPFTGKTTEELLENY
jgi:hypothetical protein|tara:strand:+ start:18262 stop:20400 length:2139 start_codon:yes stop_codon:yes gene_type:complete